MGAGCHHHLRNNNRNNKKIGDNTTLPHSYFISLFTLTLFFSQVAGTKKMENKKRNKRDKKYKKMAGMCIISHFMRIKGTHETQKNIQSISFHYCVRATWFDVASTRATRLSQFSYFFIYFFTPCRDLHICPHSFIFIYIIIPAKKYVCF